MVDSGDLFISGTILPLDEGSDKDKDSGFKCEGFGRIGTWKISGYYEGSPIIWLSTKVADYYCVKPSSGYEKHYDLLFEKACACIEVYKTLSKCPNVTLTAVLRNYLLAWLDH
jgi:DNA (cytosine-5)-methyltransferase 1